MSNSFSHRFKFDLILLLILFVIGIAALLHHFPFTISTQDETGKAMMPQQLGQSATLLILPDGTENAQTFSNMNFAIAWYNLLSQYVGTFSIALTHDIQSAAALQAQLIVIPQKTAESFNDAQIQLVSQAVQKGASLVIEMPTPEWAPLTAIKRRGKINSAIKHLTDAPNSPLAGQWRDHLLNTPLDTQIIRLDALDSETLPPDALLLELDGAIAHYRRNVGSGFVFVLAFNLGQALTSLQQGRPSENFDIETEENPLSSDFVLNDKLRQNTIPYADLLKSHVITSILYAAPMPLIWPFPDAARSALILSHETGALDDRAFEAAKYEDSLNIESTWLTTPGKISKKTLETWKSRQFDLGVSLIRPPAGRIYEPYGPSFFQPVVVEQNIINQKNAVSKRLNAPILSCKMTNSIWSHDYTLAFRKLAAAQCQIDLSYAPTQPGQFGYLFGSAFPFLPIERNGLPLPTYEFPIVINDEVGLETIPPHAALKLLTEAETTFHEPLTAHFNADTMLNHPSYTSPETWLELIQFAKDSNIWITSARGFMHHYTIRKQTKLFYAFHPQTKVLDVKLDMPTANFYYTIALPRKTSSGTLHDLWLDKKSLDMTTVKMTGDSLLMLIPVSSGEHLLQAQYQ